MVPVTSIQKLHTGFSGGILNFESCMVSQLDTEKKYKFQTLYIIYIASFHIKKGVGNYVYMTVSLYICCRHEKGQKGCNT